MDKIKSEMGYREINIGDKLFCGNCSHKRKAYTGNNHHAFNWCVLILDWYKVSETMARMSIEETQTHICDKYSPQIHLNSWGKQEVTNEDD
jgi:hypothetical protein